MDRQEISELLLQDKDIHFKTEFSSVLLEKIDSLILDKYSLDLDVDIVNLYKKFLPMKQDAPESMKQELFRVMRNYIDERISNKFYSSALFLYRFLIIKSKMLAADYIKLAEICNAVGSKDLAIEFLNIYKKFKRFSN